jgi:TolB-like protein
MTEGGGQERTGAGAPAIFISYASQDANAALRICDALRNAGFEVWFDQSDLRGGDAWDAAIRRQVKECALFMPLISANTDARSEGYFRREWNLAVNRMLDMAEDQPFLLPVVIDETPETLARVPDRFRERQWTRLAGGLASTEFVDRVMRLLAGDRATAPKIPARATAAPLGDPAHANEGFGVAVHADEGFWVAVLPFKYSGSNADVAAFADALADEIVTGLCRFSYLRVIARSSTSRYAGATADVRTIGREVGARYAIEGSVRQSGSRLRLAIQLVDTVSGAHLWADSYERSFSPETVFELQDELASRIVSTVADLHGILPRSLSELVRSRSPDELTPYEAVLRSFSYPQRPSPDELIPARAGLEAAVRKAPSYGDAWAMLSFLCVQDYAHGFNLKTDSLASGLASAQRAVEAAPSSHLAYSALAQALFFHKEIQSFRNAVERAVALNPMDGNSLAFLGEMLVYSGSAERGLELAARAKLLNPSHPGWYWYVDVCNAYRQCDYHGALAFVHRVNLPDHWPMHMFLTAIHGHLGDTAAASKALRDLLRVRPDFAATGRADVEKWFEPGFVEQLAAGWRKAGLAIEPVNPRGIRDHSSK